LIRPPAIFLLVLVTAGLAGVAAARLAASPPVPVASLYREHCAACHGPSGEGQAGWRTLDSDGTPKPPPLDRSGHAWGHGDRELAAMIRDGRGSAMPGFGGRLDAKMIDALIGGLKRGWTPGQIAFQAALNGGSIPLSDGDWQFPVDCNTDLFPTR
jgi:mono/diheme cytochrome c family protein